MSPRWLPAADTPSTRVFSVAANSTPTFKLQQGGFALQATGVTGQCAVGAEHTVARHNDGKGVAPNGSADRSHGAGSADVGAQCAIATGDAVGDFEKGAPDGLLKAGASAQIQRQLEGRASTGKVVD